MYTRNQVRGTRRAKLCAGGALIGALIATAASAQEAATLGEVIVTAQKREQSLQDVPIAVTAVTAETLQTNRITDVRDLTALAPNLTVLNTLGASRIPTFGMRGVASAGSVPGQDKSVSIYVDGVSIGSALGSVFDLPVVERIEVLRGPQGTLFGRNSTAGAVSIITHDPAGEFRLRQVLTYGNYDQFKSATLIDTPTWGPLSAAISYTHDERKGDIKNLGAGQRWDRRAVGKGIGVSPKTLGDKNVDGWFLAVKFQPNDRFTTVYKFDRTVNNYTPDGIATFAFTPEASLGAVTGGNVRTLFNTSPNVAPLGTLERPKYVNNFWSIPGYQKVYGHNVTTTIQVSDSVSLKNILAYRKSYLFGVAQTSGLGGLVNSLPVFGAIGAPFLLTDSQVQSSAKQWSEELQLNYDSKLLTLTAGVIYSDLDTTEGAIGNTRRSLSLTSVPGGVIPLAGRDFNINTFHALAGYAQAEVHVTSQLDVVGGYRLTQDKKSGINFVQGRGFPFTYKKTKPSYLVGVNYKPTDNILTYAKYATAFVAGGSVATIDFQPEIARSWEAGFKADLLDRRLRLNAAAFVARYRNLQGVTAGRNINRPELGTLVVTQGTMKTKGYELEAVVLPMRGLTFSGSLGYTEHKLSDLNPLVGLPGRYRLIYRARYTGNVSARYETEPLFGETRLMATVDANWRSKMPLLSTYPVLPPYKPFEFGDPRWNVNGRVALRNIQLSRGELEVALWGRNLTDSDQPMFPISLGFAGSTNYEAARTFGVDVIYNY